MLDVFLVHIDNEIEKSDFQRLLLSLPGDEQESVNKKVRMPDKELALITRVFLRKLLAEKYNIEPEDIAFQKNEYGKPLLTSDADLHFNISHSGRWVSFAFSSMPVGIDIEVERKFEPETLANFLHPLEKEYLFASANANKNEMFRIWTLKESYIKAIGMGMYKELPVFSVLDSRGRSIITDEDSNDDISWKLSHKMIAESTHLSICCNNECPQPSVEIFKATDHVNLFCLTHKVAP